MKKYVPRYVYVGRRGHIGTILIPTGLGTPRSALKVAEIWNSDVTVFQEEKGWKGNSVETFFRPLTICSFTEEKFFIRQMARFRSLHSLSRWLACTLSWEAKLVKGRNGTRSFFVSRSHTSMGIRYSSLKASQYFPTDSSFRVKP